MIATEKSSYEIDFSPEELKRVRNDVVLNDLLKTLFNNRMKFKLEY